MSSLKLVGIVSVYQHKATGVIVVQPMARHPTIGAPTEHGPSISFTTVDSESELAQAILKGFGRFGLPFEQKEIIRKSPAEHREFNRTHQLVRVMLYEDNSVGVLPFQYKDGTHVAAASNEILLPAPLRQDQLVTTLKNALIKATSEPA